MGLIIFLIIGVLFIATSEHGAGVLYFSENRNDLADFFFSKVTYLSEIYTYIALTILFLFIKFRYVIIIGLAGLVGLITSLGLKSFLALPRPIPYYQSLGKIDTINFVENVEVLQHSFSFPSGHTLSAFVLTGLFAFIFTPGKVKGTLLILLAIAIGVSRIYLVNHFMEDVIFGAILGFIISILLVFVNGYLAYKNYRFLERNITSFYLQ